MTLDTTDIRVRLTTFFTDQLLDAEQGEILTPQTPLRQWGVLDSLGMARIVGFIRGELGVQIPFRALTGRNFATIEDIVGMVMQAGADG